MRLMERLVRISIGRTILQERYKLIYFIPVLLLNHELRRLLQKRHELDFQLEYLKERKEVVDLCVNAFIDSLPNEGEDADEDRETFNKNIGEFNEITSELVDLIRETDQLSTSYQRKYHFNEQKN